jgi:hypothetical protein
MNPIASVAAGSGNGVPTRAETSLIYAISSSRFSCWNALKRAVLDGLPEQNYVDISAVMKLIGSNFGPGLGA